MLATISCKKDQTFNREDTIEEAKFFAVKPGTSTEAIQIMQHLKLLNQGQPFVSDFVAKVGYPIWEKSINARPTSPMCRNGTMAREGSDTTYTYTPIHQDEKNQVDAVLATRSYAGGMDFKVMNASDYKNFPYLSADAYTQKAGDIAKMFMYLDYFTFDNAKFEVKDSELLKELNPENTEEYYKRYLEIQKVQNPDNTSSLTTCITLHINNCPESPGHCLGPDGSCDHCGLCTEIVTLCFTEISSNPDGEAGGSGTGVGLPTVFMNNHHPNLWPFSWTPLPAPTAPVDQQGWEIIEKEYSLFFNNLNEPQKDFLSNNANADVKNAIIKFMEHFQFSQDSKSYAIWCINKLMTTNPNHQTFINQFLGIPEGQDGDFDQAFWENPNNNFPPQNLPSWADFKAAYPGHHDPLYDTPEKMYSSIGGGVYNLYLSDPLKYQNTCALRLSKALNYSGVTIPYIVHQTFLGSDGKYYFLGAKNMIMWMRKIFGTTNNPNYIHIEGSEIANTNFDGIKGIYGLIPLVPQAPISNPTLPNFGASGHCDLIESAQCDGGCYFNATGGVNYIDIWQLN